MVWLKRFLISIPFVFLISGCATTPTDLKTPENPNVITETTDAIKDTGETLSFLSESKDFSDLDVADVLSAPSLKEISPKAFYELDIYGVRCLVAKNLGQSFRSHFVITKDELTDQDWLDIKAFLYYETFGNFVYTDETGTEHFLLDTSKQVELMKQIFDSQMEEEDESEYSMNDEEFIDYLYEKTYEQYCETEEDKAEYRKTLENMDKSKLNALKKKYLTEDTEGEKDE